MINHPNRRKAAVSTHNHDRDYSALLDSVAATFARRTAECKAVFQTDAAGLNEAYLDNLPSERQVHNCQACRRFIERFGSLVTVDDAGALHSVMWSPDGAPKFYQEAFGEMQYRVERARIEAPFLSKAPIWGEPLTGTWSHISARPPATLIYRGSLLTGPQAMAAAKESYRTVAAALAEFSKAALDQAIRVLEAGAVSRSEHFVAPVKWLRDLQDRPKGRRGENILWRAIASAPEGYCHPRASVIGSLLEDIIAGLAFEDIKARFNAKVAPLAYQRPQAAPSSGNIAAAEAMMEKLGLGPALERRFARIEDLETIWEPAAAKEARAGGVFGHLKAKADKASVPPLDLPPTVMTWQKFAAAVMPKAERLEFYVPVHGQFLAMVTAVHADAPSLLKWDNPVSWYVYPGGASAQQFGLAGNFWVKVTAVSNLPTMWGPLPMPHLHEGAMIVLEGCKDSRNAGAGLFPEILHSELHAIRSTIEAYSAGAKIAGREEASACGYDFRRGHAQGRLRAFSAGAWQEYWIDRWD